MSAPNDTHFAIRCKASTLGHRRNFWFSHSTPPPRYARLHYARESEKKIPRASFTSYASKGDLTTICAMPPLFSGGVKCATPKVEAFSSGTGHFRV